MAAVEDARAAAVGHEAVIVSHQLPIWTHPPARRGPPPAARPAAPAVHAVLADLAALRRRPDRPGQLLGARRRPDPGQGQEGAVLGRRRARGAAPVTLKRMLLGVAVPAAARAHRLHLARRDRRQGLRQRRRRDPRRRRRRPRRTRSTLARHRPRRRAARRRRLPGQARGRRTCGARGCGPCRAEAPDVVAAADRARRQRPVRRHQPARRELRRRPGLHAEVRRADYPSVYSPDGKAMLAVRRARLGAADASRRSSCSTSEGRIAASIIGQLPCKQTLVDLVERRRGTRSSPPMADWFQETAASGSLALAVPVALVAGLVSFFSPCVIPLLPGLPLLRHRPVGRRPRERRRRHPARPDVPRLAALRARLLDRLRDPRDAPPARSAPGWSSGSASSPIVLGDRDDRARPGLRRLAAAPQP